LILCRGCLSLGLKLRCLGFGTAIFWSSLK
jgi:hypothetical protein